MTNLKHPFNISHSEEFQRLIDEEQDYGHEDHDS